MNKIVIALTLSLLTAPVSAQYVGGFTGAMNDQAQSHLIEAQARALNAYTLCLQMNPPGVCGPALQIIHPTQPAYQPAIIDTVCLDAVIGLGMQPGAAIRACSR